jgi:geranylgeranyl pyrophosphate synthase
MLPLLTYQAICGRGHTEIMPLLSAWSLHLAACHLLDNVLDSALQDRRRWEDTHYGVMALGAAQVSLARLEIDGDVLRDVIDALGRAVGLAAMAQNSERDQRSRADYFRVISGKSAAVIATGAWIGGRLATDDATLLEALKDFGLAIGMSMQISDDWHDLAEDLAAGLFTLPMIEGLSLTSHPDYPALKRLADQPALSPADIAQTIALLERMGAIDACQRIARAYQLQAAAAFKVLPTLEPYFNAYVQSKTGSYDL